MSEIPARPGSYVLWLRIANASKVQIGRLGWAVFPAGDYLYFGSAHGPGGLRARIAHHLRAVERPHWHLDWLRGIATPLGIWWVAGMEPLECQMTSMFCDIEKEKVILPGFGASDCRAGCAAHLLFFGTMMGLAVWRNRIEETLKRLPGSILDRGYCDCSGPGNQESRSRCAAVG